MTTTTKQIFTSYDSDSKTLPPFIDVHITHHEEAWLVVSNHMVMMNRLFSDCFLDEKKIRYLAEQLYYIFQEMSEIDIKLSLIYHNWVFSILDHYLQQSVCREFYEIASNLEKFNNFYTHYEPI